MYVMSVLCVACQHARSCSSVYGSAGAFGCYHVQQPFDLRRCGGAVACRYTIPHTRARAHTHTHTNLPPSIPIAILSLFRAATLEDWTDIMYINIYGCDKYASGVYYVSPETKGVE